MKPYEVQQKDFIISTDKSKLDINSIHNYLCKESYWAKNIPVETVQKVLRVLIVLVCMEQKIQLQNRLGLQG